MLLYYHSWMFHNHFIVLLYHFLVLTYWHSAKCQLLFFACFLHCRKSIPNGVQTQRNFLWIFVGPEDNQWVEEAPWGCSEESTTHQSMPGGPGASRWVVPTSGAPWTDSLLYKYTNIPETLEESMKFSSIRRRIQNHEIQSRHHHGGVHHFHWCLSNDAWVVFVDLRVRS